MFVNCCLAGLREQLAAAEAAVIDAARGADAASTAAIEQAHAARDRSDQRMQVNFRMAMREQHASRSTGWQV